MPVAGTSIHVEFFPGCRDIDEGLWDRCFPAPLEGLFWYRTLEACGLEGQFTFRYGLIRSEGNAVGIAPCFIHDVPIALVAPRPVAFILGLLSKQIPRAGLQRTFFVGSPCSDEGTIGLLPGTRLGDVAGGLAVALRMEARRLKAPMIVFKDFSPSGRAALDPLCVGGGFFPMVSYPGTLLAVPASGKEGYLRALAHTQRHNLLKKLRRSREVLALETSVVERPSPGELVEIHGLFAQTFAKGRTKFERLDVRFFECVCGQPPARFILQRDSSTGELVAFMLVFRIGDRLINKFIGIDYRRAGGTFPYFRLFEAAIDLACASGATELQSGQTGYRAKLDLGHRLVPLFNLVRHENPLVHAIYRAIGGRVTWKTLDGDLAIYLKAHPSAAEASAKGRLPGPNSGARDSNDDPS